MKVMMSANEIDTFKRYLSNSKYYLEYGSGGSTYLACTYENIEKMVSIEGDNQWVDILIINDIIKEKINTDICKIKYIDIGAPPNSFSTPSDNSKQDNWINYYNAISFIDYIPDLVLIDGRFRVACCLYLINNINSDTVVIIHDYNIRPQYFIVEHFFDVVERVDTMIVLKLKNEIDNILLETLKNKYSIDTD